jgi:tetratricopeptide (TPR) repeat protein
MTNEKNNTTPEPFVGVENALTRTEQFIEQNQKSLTIIALAIVVLVGGYLGWKKLYVAKKEKEAQGQMFVAEQYFAKDSFKLALNGDGSYPGFLTIIDEYGVTDVANIAHYYAGVSLLRMGKYTEAIKYLKQFDTNNKILGPEAIGAIGDCYSELNNYKEAASFYMKAADKDDNDFTAPIYLMKAGQVYEEIGDYKSALDAYQKVQYRYPKTTDGRQIEKYITRAKLKIK